MNEPANNAADKAAVIQKHEPNIENRSLSVAEHELRSWSVLEVAAVMEQLTPLPRISGSNQPCGPLFNQYSSRLRTKCAIWALLVTGCLVNLPFQIFGMVWLIIHGRMKAIPELIPQPTVRLLKTIPLEISYIKAPISLIVQSIQEMAALCVNRHGEFTLKRSGYAVLSHVWGDTMGWTSPTDWGPVDIQIRRRGIHYAHFWRFFDRCNSEWLWADILAMPGVLEDMSET